VNPEQLASGIIDIVKKAIAPRDAKIVALESEIAELRSQHDVMRLALSSCDRLFTAGAIAHDDEGVPWCAQRDTVSTPGTPDHWSRVQ